MPSLCFMWQQIFGGQKNLPYEVVVRNQFQKRPAVLTDFFLRACAKFKKMIKKAMLQTYLFFRLIVSYDFIFYFWGKYEYRLRFFNFFFVNTQDMTRGQPASQPLQLHRLAYFNVGSKYKSISTVWNWNDLQIKK